MKIENIKKTVFENKEQYLKFRQAWKDYVNADGHPTCEQHLIYNAFRGVDLSKMFSPITNVKKLEYQGKSPYWAFYATKHDIKFSIPKDLDNTHEFRKRRYERLMEPFGDTITHNMMQILLVELESIIL